MDVPNAMPETPAAGQGIRGRALQLNYHPGQPFVIDGQSIELQSGRISALIGPNGSGKSTLLRALARQLIPVSGCVLLNGRDIATVPSRELARNIGILSQEHVAPGDLTVEDLVYHGRFPHRGLFESLTPEDSAAVEDALRMANIGAVRHCRLTELSGGQRQLAWIAMALAQSARYLLLDEPTTFLDLANQFDVMDLVRRLNRELGRTIVLVMHDINLAARYADYLFAMRGGRIVASGPVEQVLTVETLREVFEVETAILRDVPRQTLVCIPVGKIANEPAGAQGD